MDGFPRNEDNLSGWTRVMTGKARVCAVLVLECADEVCVQRCLGRGASGSGRADDNIESLRKRCASATSSPLLLSVIQPFARPPRLFLALSHTY